MSRQAVSEGRQSHYDTDAFIQQCCQIATKRRPEYLWPGQSIAAAKYLNIEIADFLPQGVAIDPQQVGGADLIASCCRQSRRQQRMLHLPQDAMVEPGRRQTVVKLREIGSEMPFDRAAEAFFARPLFATDRKRGVCQLSVDHRRGNHFLRIERRQAAGQILEFTHIARPAMPLETIDRGL